MCGRYSLTAPANVIADIFEVDVLPEILPRYNVAPSQQVPVVKASDGVRSLAMHRWGLIPFWAKDKRIGYKTINARGETVASKPAFRASFKKKRCLIVADGFYEWKRLSKKDKIPHHIQVRDGKPFAMAGLWAKWTDPDAEDPEDADVYSCSIVTIGPNELMDGIHDRMPVILDPADWHAWLAEDTPKEQLQELIRPFPADRMMAHAVSTYVNDARHQGPECQEPYEGEHAEAAVNTTR
jgi:putative SOS response-associated peptidase YedK